MKRRPTAPRASTSSSKYNTPSSAKKAPLAKNDDLNITTTATRKPHEFHNNGSIVKIQLSNFMTYDNLEVSLGPNLNMVLGPNGSGKSAIVCSIIVGLAGDVSLTGRGGSPADFVKKGKKQSSTLIELYNYKGKNFTVGRTIKIISQSANKIDHKSEWTLNGVSAKKSDVQLFATKLNIKVDNLCQFLPQDSVAQFVKMNPSELLHNTLKAVGDSDLVDYQQKLIDLTADVSELERELDELKKASEENEVNAERLEGEVKKFKQRKKLQQQMKLCDQKIFYVKYKKIEQLRGKTREQLRTRRKELRKIEEQNEPFRRSIESTQSDLDLLKTKIKNHDLDIRKIKHSINEVQRDLESAKVCSQTDFGYFRQKEEDELSREARVAAIQTEIDNIECKLAEVRSTDCSRQLKELEKETNLKKDYVRRCIDDKTNFDLVVQSQNATLNDLKKQQDELLAIQEKKYQVLKNTFPDVLRVNEWLIKNKDKFKRKIHQPIMVEINLIDIKHKNVIENVIGRNDLSAFVCEDQDDLKLFTSLVSEQFGTRINVIHSPVEDQPVLEDRVTRGSSQNDFNAGDYNPLNASQSTRTKFARPLSADDMKKLGIVGYLIDLIEAPKAIAYYLCRSNDFHRIPYAETSINETQLRVILERHQKVFVGMDFYGKSKSRYDNNEVTTTSKVKEAQFLKYWIDRSRQEDLKLRYGECLRKKEEAIVRRRNLEELVDKGKAEWTEMTKQMRALKEKQSEKETLTARLALKRCDLDKANTSKVDMKHERAVLKKKIQATNLKIVDHLKRYVQFHKQMIDEVRGSNESSIVILVVEKNLDIAKQRFENSVKNTSLLNEQIEVLEKELRAVERSVQEICRVTHEKVDGFSKDGKLDEVQQGEFDKIAENSVEDLETKKAELDFRISRIHKDQDGSLISQYKQQVAEYNEKKLKMNSLSEELKLKSNERDSIKERWLPELESIIEVINKSYEEFMRKLNYGGRVELEFDSGNKEDFSKYGVRIMVKYRDEEHLTSLSAQRQSGGERSVATMIYMLALQTKTTVPFRCVDEINQGMDKENERKVFELLVKTADSSSSQYFLVSPKLLADLPYSDKMKIHVVFNGNYLTNSKVFKNLFDEDE